MKYATAEWPKEPRTKETKVVSLILAALFTLMALSQLFRLDNFIPLLDSFEIPGVPGRAAAITLTLAAVFAVPFLLRMKLSIGFRYLSLFFGWLVVIGWLYIVSWLNISDIHVDTVGIFGSEVTVVPGAWVIFFVTAIGILMAWSTWGMWPGRLSSDGSGAPRNKKELPADE